MAHIQTKTTKKRTRTYARNRAVSRRGNTRFTEADGTYFLKLVCVTLLGTLWLKFGEPVYVGAVVLNGIPAGTLLGLVGIHLFETDPFNRKIWYAVLVIVTIISYFVPAGIVI